MNYVQANPHGPRNPRPGAAKRHPTADCISARGLASAAVTEPRAANMFPLASPSNCAASSLLLIEHPRLANDFLAVRVCAQNAGRERLAVIRDDPARAHHHLTIALH